MSTKLLSKDALVKMIHEGWFSPEKVLCPSCNVFTEPSDNENRVSCKSCKQEYLIGPEAEKIRQQYGIKKMKAVGSGGGFTDTVFGPIASLLGQGYKHEGDYEVAVKPNIGQEIEAQRAYRREVEARKKAREEKRASKEAERAQKKQARESDPRWIARQAEKQAELKRKADLEASYKTNPVTENITVSESELRTYIRETLESCMKEMEIEHMPDGSVWSDEGELTGRRGFRSGPRPGTDAYLAPPKPRKAFPALADIYPAPKSEEQPGSVLEPSEDPNQLSLDLGQPKNMIREGTYKLVFKSESGDTYRITVKAPRPPTDEASLIKLIQKHMGPDGEAASLGGDGPGIGGSYVHLDSIREVKPRI